MDGNLASVAAKSYVDLMVYFRILDSFVFLCFLNMMVKSFGQKIKASTTLADIEIDMHSDVF